MMGLSLVVVRFVFESFWNRVFSKENITEIVLVISIVVAGFLFGYYFDWMKQKGVRRIHTQIGKDIGRGLSWLFSVNGLFLVLVASVVAVVFLIVKQSGAGAGGDKLQLLSITLTITLSALIPTMISRIVARNQLNEIIDQKLDSELQKYKAQLFNIRRDKGHASRMSAVLLEQMADSSVPGAKQQICQDNAAWSIGWASDAIIQYVLIRDVYANAVKNSAACLNIINKAASHITLENEMILSNIKLSDLKSILTMHSLIEQCNLTDSLQGEAIIQRKDVKVGDENNTSCLLAYNKEFNLLNSLETIEKAFYRKMVKQATTLNFNGFCSITGMPTEFNDELNKYAEQIIHQMQKDNPSE